MIFIEGTPTENTSPEVQLLKEPAGFKFDRPSLIQHITECWEKLPDACPTRQRGFDIINALSHKDFTIYPPKPLVHEWDCVWAEYPPMFSDIMMDLLAAEKKEDLIFHDAASRAKEAPIEGETESVSVFPGSRIELYVDFI
jgi:hypothetical protein